MQGRDRVHRTDRTQAVFGTPQLLMSAVVYEVAEETSTATVRVTKVRDFQLATLALKTGVANEVNESGKNLNL